MSNTNSNKKSATPNRFIIKAVTGVYVDYNDGNKQKTKSVTIGQLTQMENGDLVGNIDRLPMAIHQLDELRIFVNKIDDKSTSNQ